MRPSIWVKEFDTACFEANIPVLTLGSPGISKSDLHEQVSAKHHYGVLDLRLTGMDPVDINGYPIPQGGETVRTKPEVVALAERILEGPTPACSLCQKYGKCQRHEGVLLLFEELPNASPSVQFPAYQLVLNRRIGIWALPEPSRVAATGNTSDDRAYTTTLAAPLANRFIHLKLEPNLDDWVAWAFEHQVEPMIIGFLRFKPDLLFRFDAAVYGDSRYAFPTPRSWHTASNLIKASGGEYRHSLVSSAVGEGAAAELVGFAKIYRGLPSLEDIYRDPDSIEVPKEPATLYALCGALVAHAKDLKKHIPPTMRLVARFKPEYQVLVVRDLIAKMPSFTETKELRNWMAKNGERMV